MPTPGRQINLDNAKKDVARAEKEWYDEWKRRDSIGENTGVPKLTSMTDNAQLFLYERMVEIREKYPKKPNNNPSHYQYEYGVYV